MQDKLANELKTRGWSAEKLASAIQDRQCAISASTVRAWLEGRAMPNAANACAIADVFGWTLEELSAATGATTKRAA